LVMRMRPRIALLLAAAVVFVPGWHGQRPPQRSGASDLASVLAPSADEGAVREAVEVVKPLRNGRQTKLWRSGLTLASLVALSLGGMALASFAVIPIHLGSLFDLFRLGFRFSRAPPRLQPA
jgi:hypothetical protein